MTRLDDGYSRRGVLRAAAGSATALAAGAAATGTAVAQDYGGWFTGDAKGGAVGNYDGSTTDKTGQDEVTIEVGTNANGGSFGFGPAAVRVSPGTKVTFEWVSNTHNVLVEEQPDGGNWGGHESIENSGFSFSHTFETEGIYKYYCNPHLSMGMKGAIVVGGGSGGGGGGGGGVPAEYGDWFTGDGKGGAVGNFDGSTTDKTGQDSVTVTVGSNANGGSFGFGPAAVRVSPGTEVTFEWASNTHNVLVESQPDGANWSGHESIESSGFSFSHTFETEGVYKYYCNPHLSMGMKGAIVVGSAPGGGGGGGGQQTGQTARPGSGLWKSVFASGVLLAMVAPVVANYYRRRTPPGVEYDPDVDESADERSETPEADAYEPEHEIGHDEYDPVGTAALVVTYFLILVGMWVFMYFVEFLGNGPTIIG